MFRKIFVAYLQFHHFFLARSSLLITRGNLAYFPYMTIEYGIHKLKTDGCVKSYIFIYIV